MSKPIFPQREAGFTLVEILVTLAIMAAILPALLMVFRNATRSQALSDNQMTALYLLKFRMAEIEREGYPEPGQASGEFGEGSNYQWESVIEDVESEELAGLRRIRVTVTWQHLGRPKAISMYAYIADRQIQQAQQQ